ncbi:hypothetical protein Holit_02538 [Hollandina sp. SP2]
MHFNFNTLVEQRGFGRVGRYHWGWVLPRFVADQEGMAKRESSAESGSLLISGRKEIHSSLRNPNTKKAKQTLLSHTGGPCMAF